MTERRTEMTEKIDNVGNHDKLANFNELVANYDFHFIKYTIYILEIMLAMKIAMFNRILSKFIHC